MKRSASFAVVTPVAMMLAGTGCATAPALEPGAPLEVRAQPLPPYQVHEECVALLPGDRLRYRFTAQAPIAFDIRFHDGKAVVMPVTREGVVTDAGVFAPIVAREYCLTWEAGAAGTTLDYSVHLVRPRDR